jgi:hypothetical protein
MCRAAATGKRSQKTLHTSWQKLGNHPRNRPESGARKLALQSGTRPMRIFNNCITGNKTPEYGTSFFLKVQNLLLYYFKMF